MWEKGLLGEHSPVVLRDTIVWFCGMFFCGKGSQIATHEMTDGRKYIEYREQGSKNNAGGINT